jgi:cyclopropane-fatty-acyl-phospholipid synthase
MWMTFLFGGFMLGTTKRELPRFEVSPATSHLEKPLSAAGRRVAQFLSRGDIRINGGRGWDIQVHDPRMYQRVLSFGSIGVGESYMDGWWDVEALDEFFARVDRVDPYDTFGTWATALLSLKGKIFNRQKPEYSVEVARKHYDLGNDVYQAMLGRRMQYTCAYWRDADNLDGAQENKLHLIARKLHLKPGMTVLDLGGGFGGLAQFIASEYGCPVVSYNLSREQVRYGRELCRGLSVRFENKDYREAISEPRQFDRVASIGLCEHIGFKNYHGFLSLMRHCLKDQGLCLVHTIGSNQSVSTTDAWIDKYIFPNGVVPSIAQLGQAMEDGWVVEDWHNFGPDYDRTLMAWWDNFERNWPALREKYGDRFYRMWRFYLKSCAGRFRARQLQLWQVVLSKGDIGRYDPVR